MRLCVLILLTLSGCTASRTHHAFEAPAHYPTAAKLKTCPYGHEELKDVPIVYGLVFPTEETVRKQENLEVYLGGCIATDRQTQVVCRRCRFVHIGEDEWSRRHEDPKTFDVELAAIVRALPLSAFEDTSPTYRQRMSRGAVVEDSVSMRVPGFEEDIEKHVAAYLREQGAVDVTARDDLRYGPARVLEGRWRDRHVRAQISPGTLGTYVTFAATTAVSISASESAPTAPPVDPAPVVSGP